jgi:hypothetical protein
MNFGRIHFEVDYANMAQDIFVDPIQIDNILQQAELVCTGQRGNFTTRNSSANQQYVLSLIINGGMQLPDELDKYCDKVLVTAILAIASIYTTHMHFHVLYNSPRLAADQMHMCIIKLRNYRQITFRVAAMLLRVFTADIELPEIEDLRKRFELLHLAFLYHPPTLSGDTTKLLIIAAIQRGPVAVHMLHALMSCSEIINNLLFDHDYDTYATYLQQMNYYDQLTVSVYEHAAAMKDPRFLKLLLQYAADIRRSMLLNAFPRCRIVENMQLIEQSPEWKSVAEIANARIRYEVGRGMGNEECFEYLLKRNDIYHAYNAFVVNASFVVPEMFSPYAKNVLRAERELYRLVQQDVLPSLVFTLNEYMPCGDITRLVCQYIYSSAEPYTNEFISAYIKTIIASTNHV